MESSVRERPRLDRTARASSIRALEKVREALDGLQYGAVTVIVQDGVIVQVERTDKLRLSQTTR